MSYVRKVIGADEQLVLITRLHWIYLFEACFFFIIITGTGLLIDYFLWHYAGSKLLNYEIDLYFITFTQEHTPIPFAFALTGFAVFWPLFTTYISTEIGLTQNRIIHKRGLVLIEVQQIELDDVRGENINHGWLGWILGYGRLHFDCRFIHDVYLPATRDPYKLVKAVHTARMRHNKIAYNIDDLDSDIERLDKQRLIEFKIHNKLKLIGRKLRRDFNIKR